MRSIGMVLLLAVAVEAHGESALLKPKAAAKDATMIAAGALATERQSEPKGRFFKEGGKHWYCAPNGEVFEWVPGHWKQTEKRVSSKAVQSTTTGIRTVVPRREPPVRITYPDRTTLGFSNHYYFEGDGHFTD